MKRFLLAMAGVLALVGAVPASAGATITELGVSTTPLVAPSCPTGVSPAQCTIILTRATALETIRDNVAYPSTVKQAGRFVAFTVGLSALSTNATTAQNDIKFLDKTYGGDAQVEITVLKPVGAKSLREWQVVESSPLVDVQPYLGQVVQFPLTTSLPVVRGETIALTTPDLGAGSLDRPVDDPLRLPAEPQPQLQQPALDESGAGDRGCERPLHVRLPGDTRRVQRHRGDEPGADDDAHHDADADQEEDHQAPVI